MSKTQYPFSPSANFDFTLPLDTGDVDFNMVWLDVLELWVISAYKNGLPLTEGRVVVNNQDILGNVEGYGLLQFEGSTPTRNNIGNECFLYYYGVNDDL